MSWTSKVAIGVVGGGLALGSALALGSGPDASRFHARVIPAIRGVAPAAPGRLAPHAAAVPAVPAAPAAPHVTTGSSREPAAPRVAPATEDEAVRTETAVLARQLELDPGEEALVADETLRAFRGLVAEVRALREQGDAALPAEAVDELVERRTAELHERVARLLPPAKADRYRALVR